MGARCDYQSLYVGRQARKAARSLQVCTDAGELFEAPADRFEGFRRATRPRQPAQKQGRKVQVRWFHRKGKSTGLSDQIAMGSNAAQLLGDSLLQETIDSMRDDCVDAWRNSKTLNEREAAWALLSAVDSFEARLRARIAHGKHASTELRRENDAMAEARQRNARLSEQQRQVREAAENRRRVRGEAA